jgi:hypothetical protein
MRININLAGLSCVFGIVLIFSLYGCSGGGSEQPDTGSELDSQSVVEDVVSGDTAQGVPDSGLVPDQGTTLDTGSLQDAPAPVDSNTLSDSGFTADSSSNCHDSEDPKVHYIGNSLEECAVIDFDCTEPLSEPFTDDCGCGCLDVCPDESSSLVTYASMDPQECMVMMIGCEEDELAFSNGCGCGCITVCENQNDPNYQYVGHSPEECELIDFGCNDGPQEYFSDACGCGCWNKD